jgi:4'-phosphopantetheinyl transferase
MSINLGLALPELPAGLSLRFCALDDDRDIALDHATSLLSQDEADRAAAFRFSRDQARFVRARGFLRRELATVLGSSPVGVALGTGPQGKPCITDHPLGFNLSHSAGLAVLALNFAGPVGIDLESLAMARGASALSDTCLTPAEALALDPLPAEERETRFLAFWTAKEAAVKLTGTGWTVDPASVALRLTDGLPDAVMTPPARLIPVLVPGYLCHVALPADTKGRR